MCFGHAEAVYGEHDKRTDATRRTGPPASASYTIAEQAGTAEVIDTHVVRAGYERYPCDFAKLIRASASPRWDFADATFDRTAASFDNPNHIAS